MTEHGSSPREPDRRSDFGGSALDGPGRVDQADYATERSGVLGSMKDEPAETAAADQFPPLSTIDMTPLKQRFDVSTEGSEE